MNLLDENAVSARLAEASSALDATKTEIASLDQEVINLVEATELHQKLAALQLANSSFSDVNADFVALLSAGIGLRIVFSPDGSCSVGVSIDCLNFLANPCLGFLVDGVVVDENRWESWEQRLRPPNTPEILQTTLEEIAKCYLGGCPQDDTSDVRRVFTQFKAVVTSFALRARRITDAIRSLAAPRVLQNFTVSVELPYVCLFTAKSFHASFDGDGAILFLHDIYSVFRYAEAHLQEFINSEKDFCYYLGSRGEIEKV